MLNLIKQNKLMFVKTILVLILTIQLVIAEDVKEHKGSEYEEFTEQYNLGRNNKIFSSDENGKIAKTSFSFDPKRWHLDILIKDFDEGSACIFELYYFLEKEIILVKKQNPKANKILMGDLIVNLKKNKNMFAFEKIYFKATDLKFVKEDCKTGSYKGVNEIKHVMGILEKNNVPLVKYTLIRLESVQLSFSKVNYEDFQPKSFKKLANFNETSTQKQIIQFLEKRKYDPITSINNQKYLNELKNIILEQQKIWKNKIKLFCQEFQIPQGSFKGLFNFKILDFLKELLNSLKIYLGVDLQK
jgi:hypothetical protein